MWLILVLCLLAVPIEARAEYETIDEIAGAYAVETCRDCHDRIHDEWLASAHAHSVANSVGILRTFIEERRQNGKEVDRSQLMRCMACHAPHLEKASETLVREVIRLVLAADGGTDEAEREAAKRSLDRLNINCIICHNTVAVLEKDQQGEPEKDVYYGPAGNSSPAHGTERTTALGSYLFCGQCHRVHTPPDGEIIFCSSLYESYQDAYRGQGGAATCQDCHIRKGQRGHRMPGGSDPDLLREGIELTVEAIGLKLKPGKWVPTAFVNVQLINKAGHRTPDG
jgi:Zn-finger protein